jgi:hypothetical protein
LAAPDYGISAPGDTNRLFVVEQNGLLRVIQNGSLLSTPALDIQSRVAPPLVTSNATDERGFLGLAFHPGFNDPLNPGYRTLYTYSSQPVPVGSTPTYPTPNGASTAYENVISEWKMSASDPNVGVALVADEYDDRIAARVDERFTSVEAESRLRGQKRKPVDSVAAQLMLEQYFDELA